MVTADENLVVNWSAAPITMLTDWTVGTAMVSIVDTALTAFPLVVVVKLLVATNTQTVVDSSAANVILCAPAANTAVTVVHTIVTIAAVIVQVAVSVAVPPEAGTSTPAGLALALK